MAKKLMFKILHFTDTHYTRQNPENRKDIMFDAAIKKTKEVAQIGKDHKVDFYLHTGDFFNSADISDAVAGEVGKVYKKAFDKKVIVLPGGHDLRHNNIMTIEQTKLGLFGKLGIVKILNFGERVFAEKEGFKLEITGVPSETLIDRKKDLAILREKEADFSIYMLHSMVLKENKQVGTYIPISEIQKETKANLTLIGHYHLGFETGEYFDSVMGFTKYFINPGALVRKYNFIEEIKRTPQVALICIYDDKSVDIEYIPLKSALKGEEVLDRQKMMEQREYKEKLVKFTQGIVDFTRDKKDINLVTDIEEIFKTMCENEPNMDDGEKIEIEKIGLAFIEDAKQVLGLSR
ncbi:metallophosphoesterase [Alkaliphilus sp. B6464]|uniref:metallophosphoesterase n=1 Tax=Alkaliphilus sp. B6464 TaxID=2731219 RepID=UPI001BA83634|nr:metallophosphoesterase [Alkaliphilus sp. B6464]QUH22062.1 metallophosphoesterase [Alkaliphilus sp. B6464]